MKTLIVFCPWLFDYLVPADIISQYLIFYKDNVKKVFLDNNLNVKYFWEFLDDISCSNISDINYNLLHLTEKYIGGANTISPNQINSCGPGVTLFTKALDKILTIEEYRGSIFFGWEAWGFDPIVGTTYYTKLKNYNAKFIVSIYDPHSFHIIYNNGNGIDPSEKHIFKDERLDNTDLIISSSHKYYKNINSLYLHKSYFIPFSYDSTVKELYIFDETQWNIRDNYIYLIGAINLAYPLRMQINNYINKKEKNTIFKIDTYERHNRTNHYNNKKRGGIIYHKKLCKYKAIFICFGKYPIDFPLAKLWEGFLAGCLCFIEPKDFLKDLGLFEYEHYIPIKLDTYNNFDNNNFQYYKYWLNNNLSINIAKKGHDYIKKNFTDEKVAKLYCDIINKNLY